MGNTTKPLIVRMMRRVAKQLAINKVQESVARLVLDEIVDEARAESVCDSPYYDADSLPSWEQTFIYDYFVKGVVECKSCKSWDSTLEMRGDVCTNCY